MADRGRHNIGYLKDITPYGATFQPLDLKGYQKEKALQYVLLRDAYERLYRYESNLHEANVPWREHLNTCYDEFVMRYGNLNAKQNVKLVMMDAGGRDILSLERAENGKFVKADIFERPVSFSVESHANVGSPEEALSASLNKFGTVDLDYMREITDSTAEDLLTALQGRIYYNPLVTGYEIKDRFIAGNVIEKAERIEAWMGENPESERMPEVKQALEALKDAEPPRIAFEDLDFNFGEPNGKTYELIDNRTTVTVAYKVRTLDAGSISASDFRAYIDLADMYEPTGAVPVKVDVKNNKVDAVTAKPMVIRVTTEDVQQKKFDLTAYTEGKTESGYREGTVNIVPTSIYVSGPESQVGRISTVGITIRLDGANSDLSGTAQIQCFDANRNKITLDDRVTLSRSEADYTLSILKVKTLGLNFETEGRVADGYRFTGIESNVNSVDVVGLKSDLAEINAINIPKSELNMDGASADKEVIIDLNKYLPENVELADSNSKIHVTLKVEPLETRTIELKTSKIRQVGASSRYSYQYDRDAIRLSIKGLQEDLDQLTDDDLEAEVDVSDMGPGTHPGTVTFELGAAYELVSQDDLQIIVHDREPGDTVPAPTQEETGSSTRETTAAESSSGASNHTTAAETSH